MILDSYLLANFGSDADVVSRLPAGWREYLGMTEGPTSFPHGISARPALPNPLGRALPGSVAPGHERPGTDVATTVREHLDAHGIGRAVVSHDAGRSVAALPHLRLATELVHAANAWMREEVLPADPHLTGTLLVPLANPAEAARTIRAAAGDPAWSAVMFSANALGHPFGHPVYHPVLEAAAEARLPVVVDAEADAWLDVPSNPASGRPTTHTDQLALAGQPLSTHVVSMISQGVFEMWPELRLVVVGAGVAWVVPLLWRFDDEFKAFHRDAPGLRMLPSEYFARNVRVGTCPLDRFATPETLHAYLLTMPELRGSLLYGSGYPLWNRDTPDDLRTWLPTDWTADVLGGNAAALFAPTTVSAW